MFFKRGGVLRWLFALEVFALGIIFLLLGLRLEFVFGLIVSVSSACILITFLVNVLVSGNSTNFWFFSF
jgi:hypothetical protein